MPQAIVHDLLQRRARPPRLGAELGRNIIVESQGCSHTLMLRREHHDVNLPPDWIAAFRETV
ncbi:MAG: hypothetical protein ABSF46_04360 [Terriglobia bacterium]|jgi:hypothetical protein